MVKPLELFLVITFLECVIYIQNILSIIFFILLNIYIYNPLFQIMYYIHKVRYFYTITKESWAPKNWCFWTVVLKQTLESPLDCKEIQPGHPKGDQSWVFTGRTDVEAEAPILWPPHAKSWLIWKDPDAGKGWRQEEKGMTEDEMIGWYHWLNGCEFG